MLKYFTKHIVKEEKIMERKGEMTKALLGQKFKELVVKKSFDKITIKMITDEAGVIRPTFYNYFQDKYEVMEWLLWEDVFKSATELVKMNMARSALEMIFKKFAVDKEYYARVFEVKGQNSFEDMLYQSICRLVHVIVEENPVNIKEGEIISKETFLQYEAMTLVNGIKYWILRHRDEISAEEAVKFYEFLVSHSLIDIIGQDTIDKVIN